MCFNYSRSNNFEISNGEDRCVCFYLLLVFVSNVFKLSDLFDLHHLTSVSYDFRVSLR
jgi:hypothetical protein